MLPKVRITRRGLGAIILAIGAGLLMTAVLPREVSSDLFAARDQASAQALPARAISSSD